MKILQCCTKGFDFLWKVLENHGEWVKVRSSGTAKTGKREDGRKNKLSGDWFWWPMGEMSKREHWVV